jgi:hypothetical protein
MKVADKNYLKKNRPVKMVIMEPIPFKPHPVPVGNHK